MPMHFVLYRLVNKVMMIGLIGGLLASQVHMLFEGSMSEWVVTIMLSVSYKQTGPARHHWYVASFNQSLSYTTTTNRCSFCLSHSILTHVCRLLS